MKASELARYRHPEPLQNAPYEAAHRVMMRVFRPGLWRMLRYRYVPPRGIALGIIPPGEHDGANADVLTHDLVQSDAFIMEPLHYVLIFQGASGNVAVYCAALLCWAFALGEREGYAVARKWVEGL